MPNKSEVIAIPDVLLSVEWAHVTHALQTLQNTVGGIPKPVNPICLRTCIKVAEDLKCWLSILQQCQVDLFITRLYENANENTRKAVRGYGHPIWAAGHTRVDDKIKDLADKIKELARTNASLVAENQAMKAELERQAAVQPDPSRDTDNFDSKPDTEELDRLADESRALKDHLDVITQSILPLQLKQAEHERALLRADASLAKIDTIDGKVATLEAGMAKCEVKVAALEARFVKTVKRLAGLASLNRNSIGGKIERMVNNRVARVKAKIARRGSEVTVAGA